MPTYSNSKLSTYETCPLQFKLHYIDRAKVAKKEGIAPFLGSRVHDALEKLYKDLRYSKLLTLDELIKFYNDIWDKKWDDSVIIEKKELSAQNYRDTGIRCLKDYYKRYAPFNQAAIIGVEENIRFSLSGDGKYKINGYIDRLDRIKDGVYEIHDYKTSGKIPLQEKLDVERQLGLYEIGIRRKFADVKEVRLIWHYLVFDTDVSSTRTPEQLEDLRKETIALIDKIESDKEFKHTENTFCEWCDYWAYCPAKKHLIKIEGMPLQEFLSEDGVALVNKYASAWNRAREAEEEKERLREALIAYAKKEGVETINGSDRTVKVTFEDGTKFPPKDAPEREELEKIIKAAGLWDKVSELDKKSLKEAIEAGRLDKKLLKKIKEFLSVEETANVRISRQKEEEEEE